MTSLSIDQLSFHISHAPDDPDAYAQRAHAYIILSENSLAEADIDTALRLDPRYEDALLLRGTLRYDSLELQDALTDMNAIIECNPTHPDARFFRALVLTHLGAEPDEIRRDIQQAGKASITDPRYYYVYAALALKQGDFTDVLSHTDVGLALECDDHVAEGNLWQLRARTLAELHRTSEAIAAFDTAISIIPNSAHLRAVAAARRYRIAEWPEALHLADGALSIEPSADVSILKAEIQHAASDTKNAVQTLVKVAKASPGRMDLWTTAGNILRGSGHYGDALRICRLMSGHPEAAGLALIEEAAFHHAMGDRERALEILESVMSGPDVRWHDLAALRHAQLPQKTAQPSQTPDILHVRTPGAPELISVEIYQPNPQSRSPEANGRQESGQQAAPGETTAEQPGKLDRFIERSRHRVERGDIAGARKDARRALEIAPDDRRAAAALIAAVSADSATDRNPREMRELMERYPEFEEPPIRVAGVLSSHSKDREAIEVLVRARRTLPNSPRLHGLLGQAYAKCGEFELALDCSNAIISIGEPVSRRAALLTRASVKVVLGDSQGLSRTYAPTARTHRTAAPLQREESQTLWK